MKHIFPPLCLICCLMAVSAFGQSGRSLVNGGNKLFDKEKYDEALSNYKEALGKKVPQDITHYDLGNVYYKKNSYDQAEKEFDPAIQSKNPELQARGYFNRGNARFKQQQFDKSIADYIEVLKRNPQDIGAKVNLELARRMLQMQKQQQQQQNQSKQDSTQQKQDQKQQQQKQDQQKQDQQQKQEQQQQKQQEKQDNSQQKSDEEKQLSQAEAEKVLDALQNDEKQVIREMIRHQLPPPRTRGKDW